MSNKTSLKENLKEQLEEWLHEGKKKKDIGSGLSMLGVVQDGVWIYNPKTLRFRWYIYPLMLIGGYYSILGVFFWAFVFGTNILKVKGRMFKVVDYSQVPYEWLFNKVITIDKKKYSKEEGKVFRLEANQRWMVLFKALVGFLVMANVFSANVNQIDFVFGEEDNKEVESIPLVNMQGVEGRADAIYGEIMASVKPTYPSLGVVSSRLGSRVFSDTTAAFTVIKSLTKDDSLVVEGEVSEWYIVSVDSITGFVFKEHLNLIK
jgi:hypothetical protein